ncbi:hypothetical protein DYB38_004930 [Aphanomyces astaci]|uniref:EF-hand domain-containing protein n=1 Tax=Aphanomyces astaci TaxID=112090 RepID=A0A397DMV5_APHAT|nr:hypothetical protein DYB38_004930 [Aphanomyces astaci]
MIRYMTSIFRVMYETSDRAKDQMRVPPSELAKVTATACFADADLNHDKKLSFAEFKQVHTQLFTHLHLITMDTYVVVHVHHVRGMDTPACHRRRRRYGRHDC